MLCLYGSSSRDRPAPSTLSKPVFQAPNLGHEKQGRAKPVLLLFTARHARKFCEKATSREVPWIFLQTSPAKTTSPSRHPSSDTKNKAAPDLKALSRPVPKELRKMERKLTRAQKDGAPGPRTGNTPHLSYCKLLSSFLQATDVLIYS